MYAAWLQVMPQPFPYPGTVTRYISEHVQIERPLVLVSVSHNFLQSHTTEYSIRDDSAALKKGQGIPV